MKVIAKESFGKQVFVQCDCIEEIMEICRDYENRDDENSGLEYFIKYYGDRKRKKGEYTSFTFSGEEDFDSFIRKIEAQVYGVDDGSISIFYDKYLSYKNKRPGVLICLSDICGNIMIVKFADPRCAEKAKPTWEIVLKKEQAKQLVEEIRGW